VDFCNTEMVRPNNTTGNLRMAAMCELPDGVCGVAHHHLHQTVSHDARARAADERRGSDSGQ
jgi:hypothetical protein